MQAELLEFVFAKQNLIIGKVELYRPYVLDLFELWTCYTLTGLELPKVDLQATIKAFGDKIVTFKKTLE